MKMFKNYYSFCMALGIGVMLSGVALAQGRSDMRPVRWMAPEALSRNELVEAMASEAGLSKADAKKALDGFVNATVHALSDQIDRPVYCWGSSSTKDFLDPDDDGDGFSDEILFGVFSAVSGPVGANGCPLENEVVFLPGRAFRVSPHTAGGENVAAPDRCENPLEGFDDDDIIDHIVSETRLPFDTVALALATLYATVVDVVNSGGIVDLEGFGRFEAETVITATITETRGPPLVVIDVWEQSVSLVGASRFEIEQAGRNLEQKARRSARTGRNPQTGKEIQIAAKNVVRFKAGADLSKSVN